MNTEEFKYLVLKTFADWQAGFSESVLVHADGHLSLRPAQPLTSLEGIEHPTGFAVDPRGNLYVIDAPNCLVYKYMKLGKALQPIGCIGGCGTSAGEFRFSLMNPTEHFGGLALGKSTLYVADTVNDRIQAFHLQTFQIRFILGKKDENGYPVPGQEAGEFKWPRTLVTDSRENLYVLDHGNKRIQKFNQCGTFLSFIGNGILKRPEGMAVDQNDNLYVIDSKANHILKFDQDGIPLPPFNNFEEIKAGFIASAIAIDNRNLIYISEKKRGGNNLNFHILDANGKYLGNFGNYAEGCYQLVADRQGNLYANCGPDGRIVLLSGTQSFESRGVYYSKTFDSYTTTPETKWHRIALDTIIAEKTKINVYYHASDTVVDDPHVIPADDWSRVLSSPRNGLESEDGLFFNAYGRYLRLKIEMIGDEYHTPVINQLRVYFPRISFLRYLPGTYQEDDAGREFLERFLSLFESLSFDMEEQIAYLSRYFDSRATDREFLSWLGSWLAIARDENWSEERQRKLITRAYDLYKIRGTLHGLREIVKLYSDHTPLIVEHFRLKTPMVLGTDTRIGFSTAVGKSFNKRLVLEETSTIGDFVLIEQDEKKDFPEKPFEADAFNFTIYVNASGLKGEEQRKALKRIIREEKPAHTRCIIRTGEGGMKLGFRSFLEIDTAISRGFPFMRLGVESRVGKETFLGTKYPAKGTIEARSRIAIETILH